MALTLELVRLVEELVDAKLPGRFTAKGTVASRSAVSTDTTLMVTLDGSAQAVPVRVFGNAWAQPGDRVGLVRFGSDWVVVDGFTAHWPQERGYLVAATSGNTSTGSYTGIPADPSFQFEKAWDDTLVRVDLSAGCRTDTAETAIALGADFSGTTYNIAYHLFSAASHRHIVAGFHPGISGIPRGTHTVKMKWLKALGGGALYMDSNDWVALSAREIGP